MKTKRANLVKRICPIEKQYHNPLNHLQIDGYITVTCNRGSLQIRWKYLKSYLSKLAVWELMFQDSKLILACP